MAMTVEDMVTAVVKRITTSTLGDTALRPEKAAQLVREIEKSTPLLSGARRIDMQSDKRDIDRVGFRSRIMGAPPAEGDTASQSPNPTFTNNQLSVVRATGVVELTDETLEDNLERSDFEDTLISLIGERAGIDLEELYVQGDTASADTYLALTDGWFKLAGHSIDAAVPDFDATDVEDMFEQMLVTLINNNPEFMRRRQDLGYWVTWKQENDYREALRARGTQLGDEAQTDNRPLAYKGIPVKPIFNLPTGDAMLGAEENFVYGIRRDVRLEQDRRPRESRTDFVVTFRTDAHFEDERGVVTATGYTGP